MKFFYSCKLKDVLTVMTWRLLSLCLMVLYVENFSFVEASTLPDKIVYLYNQPLKLSDPKEVLSKIENGEYTDTLFKGPLKIAQSHWVFIPKSILFQNLDIQYFLLGAFDDAYLYKYSQGTWDNPISTSLFINHSSTSYLNRISFKLFDNKAQMADYYLVKCIRSNDYTFGMLEGQLMTEKGIDHWLKDLKDSLETYIMMFLPFWGILFMAFIILIARFVISRDYAYLVFAIGNFFFILNYYLLHYSNIVMVDYYPLNNVRLGIAITGPSFIIGQTMFIFSFRFFYKRKTPLLLIVKRITSYISIYLVTLSVINVLINYYFRDWFYYTNLLMYGSLFILMFIVYLILIRYKAELNESKEGAPYLFILKGSYFLFIAAAVGLLLSVIYAHNVHYISNYFLLSFPLLVGISIYNIFLILALLQRDFLIEKEVGRISLIAAENESRVLQSTLNPHFIFNSLNLIDYFVYNKNSSKAREVLFQFSDLLRMVIDRTSEKTIPLSEEIKILDLFLKLESSRNIDLFTYQIIVEEDLDVEYINIPPMLVQPLVENAIKHGILNMTEGKGKIDIEFKRVDMLLEITVKDNGVGFISLKDDSMREIEGRKHLGMNLTRRRLELFSQDASMTVDNIIKGHGTIVKIKIPIV
ncbi:MAG: histidine kinase [Chitinophagales bacterium]|nr:histidine kinase [Chitinophagales bacterium]